MTLPEGLNQSAALEYVDQPTNTFLIDKNTMSITRMDEGIDAMKQAVDIMLNIARFGWQIYDSNFGSELYELPGEDFEYIRGEFPRMVEDALSIDNRIISVEDFEYTRGADYMTVTFTVNTVIGAFNEEVTI